MPRGRSFRTPVRTQQRRKLVWATKFMDSPVTAAAGINTYDLLGDFRALGGSVLGCTVMRVHIQLVPSASTLVGSWMAGIAVGRLSDIAANKIDPTVDVEIDWMLLRKFYSGSSAGVVDAQTVYEIDLRSKRKIQELDQALLFVVRNGYAAANDFHAFGRTLVALP
jgi:hypothetical protein